MSLKMHDRPGRITVAEMRRDFEMMIRDTPILRNTVLTAVTELDGRFSSYLNEETDKLWIGFALGRRCAEQLTEPLIENTKYNTLIEASRYCDAQGMRYNDTAIVRNVCETMSRDLANRALKLKEKNVPQTVGKENS